MAAFIRGRDSKESLGIGLRPYLFKIKLWQLDPYEYFIQYGENEEDSRIKAASRYRFNSGAPVKPEDLILVTYF